jgi:hypothetical protein
MRDFGAGQYSILAKRTQNIIDISIDLAVTSRRISLLFTRCLVPATANET